MEDKSVVKNSGLVHPNISDGWFYETSTFWPGQKMALEVQEILHVEKSKFQDVLVFSSKTYGNVLVLDGAIQATERDEFSYQEMITHIPMNSHPNPKRVLVIGGGDGGVLREVLKHECVEEAVLCDIDEAVIRVSKKYLPGMAIGFEHPKATVIVGDGLEYMRTRENYFDVIITDSSDPVGPAESLFGPEYYTLMHKALREGGITSAQGECQWLHTSFIKTVLDFSRNIFPVSEYAFTTIPTYPSGQIGFILCSKSQETNFKEPLRRWSPEQELKLCKYYNHKIHSAGFVLPNFTRSVLMKSD
ncbi:Spermidine synthase [Zancudomyces culisetae]|uniref:Spermidine synthase n=1 Tax=Zancudomyces culisetae TaxID=1213189 RepID=A0A1R1PW39_ZANCU|nr:Spermidine synthase [Zancudomyces culisetae]|eukprot:OMH85187.1 Spermidine synthase [Zancudomyces culisetae]